MGRLRDLTESIHEFITEYDSTVAGGDGRYDISTKISMLLLKEKTNKPMGRLKDYPNEVTSSAP
jgi:hypothetical protein